MKQTFEVWAEEENGRSITLGDEASIKQQRAQGLLKPSAKLLFTVVADTWDEAEAVKNIKLGWEPYRPQGKAKECPRGCGAMYYPESWGDCPNCGKIG